MLKFLDLFTEVEGDETKKVKINFKKEPSKKVVYAKVKEQKTPAEELGYEKGLAIAIEHVVTSGSQFFGRDLIHNLILVGKSENKTDYIFFDATEKENLGNKFLRLPKDQVLKLIEDKKVSVTRIA